MMTVLDLKVLLLRRGITTADLAARAGCSPAMIRAVITRAERSPRIRAVIARRIGKPVASVFGARTRSRIRGSSRD